MLPIDDKIKEHYIRYCVMDYDLEIFYPEYSEKLVRCLYQRRNDKLVTLLSDCKKSLKADDYDFELDNVVFALEECRDKERIEHFLYVLMTTDTSAYRRHKKRMTIDKGIECGVIKTLDPAQSGILYGTLKLITGDSKPKKMAIIPTRPLSPNGQPFTGYFITVNSGQERSVIQIENGNPTVEPIELMPGRYSIEWIEAEKEPQFDVAVVPDKPEVELSDILSSLKGEPVEEEAVKTVVPQPEEATPSTSGSVATDATVGHQPPGTEQEVAGQSVTTKRKGSPDA